MSGSMEIRLRNEPPERIKAVIRASTRRALAKWLVGDIVGAVIDHKRGGSGVGAVLMPDQPAGEGSAAASSPENDDA